MKNMWDSITERHNTALYELEGDCNANVDNSWTRRLIEPWGLFFPVEGTGEIALEGEKISVPQGSLLVYKPGYRYRFTGRGFWRYFWFHYPLRDHLIGQMNFEEVLPGLGLRNPDLHDRKRIRQELEEAVALEKMHRPGWEALALLLVETVLQRFSGMGNTGSRRDSDRIHRAVQLLTGERFCKMEEIAAECRISPPMLFKIFREEMGCSPREYREQFFLRQGKKLLLNTDLTIDEIAEACHACDRYYFSNRFKRLFGISPVAFRKGLTQR